MCQDLSDPNLHFLYTLSVVYSHLQWEEEEKSKKNYKEGRKAGWIPYFMTWNKLCQRLDVGTWRIDVTQIYLTWQYNLSLVRREFRYLVPLRSLYQTEALWLSDGSEQPMPESLCSKPLCQTRSKALLMSQKTGLTSFPLSTDAWQKWWHVCISWKMVVSPDTKPDWRRVSIWLNTT